MRRCAEFLVASLIIAGAFAGEIVAQDTTPLLIRGPQGGTEQLALNHTRGYAAVP